MSTLCCFYSTLNGPVPGQRRPVFRNFGQDVNASRNSLGRFPSQSEDRSLPSPVSSSTSSTPHRAATSLLPAGRLVLLQPQNPENMSFLPAAVRLRQSQVMLRARCHVQVVGNYYQLWSSTRRSNSYVLLTDEFERIKKLDVHCVNIKYESFQGEITDTKI